MQNHKANERVAPSVLVVGNGRIGKNLSKSLINLGYECSSHRLDPNSGIDFHNYKSDLPKILVICISAVGKNWTWDIVLNGLLKQISEGEICFSQIVLVSSTRVYEGYLKGIVTAQSHESVKSIKAIQILAAEKALLDCELNSWIIRCSGLYGEDYPKYTPIMRAAEDKPRSGVQTSQVVDSICELISEFEMFGGKNGVQLLTDGFCYFKGRKYKEDTNEVLQLSKQYRILRASSHPITQGISG